MNEYPLEPSELGHKLGKYFYQYRPAANFLVKDEDAAEFLQSQFSNELRPFESSKCTYGLWLNVKGKVVGDSIVLCEDASSFRVLSECSKGDLLAAHMQRHIIADDVLIEHSDPGYIFELSTEAVEALGLTLPQAGHFTRLEGGTLIKALDNRYRLLISSSSGKDAWIAKFMAIGCKDISEADFGLRRITAGIPLIPREIGSTDFPGEGELERDAISFTKGCYLGQEVVARMHNIGKAHRRLFVLEGHGTPPEIPLNLYNSDKKLVGELRSAYKNSGFWRGVAILKTRFATTGLELQNENMDAVVINPLRENPKNGSIL